MKDGLKIMDSDMHVREPADLWEKYIEPKWRDRAPKILSTTTRSSAMVMVDGKILKGYPPAYRGGIFDATRIDKEIAGARARGFDGVSQLDAMEKEGLDLAVMFPSIGLGVMMREDMDPKLGAAIARAYNNWLYDFCQTDPERMKGSAMISLHDVTEAAKEARRAVRNWGSWPCSPAPSRSAPCRGIHATTMSCGPPWKSWASPWASTRPPPPARCGRWATCSATTSCCGIFASTPCPT